MIAVSPEHSRDMLEGMHHMGEHFRTVPFEGNIPGLMALPG